MARWIDRFIEFGIYSLRDFSTRMVTRTCDLGGFNVYVDRRLKQANRRSAPHPNMSSLMAEIWLWGYCCTQEGNLAFLRTNRSLKKLDRSGWRDIWNRGRLCGESLFPLKQSPPSLPLPSPPHLIFIFIFIFNLFTSDSQTCTFCHFAKGSPFHKKNLFGAATITIFSLPPSHPLSLFSMELISCFDLAYKIFGISSDFADDGRRTCLFEEWIDTERRYNLRI